MEFGEDAAPPTNCAKCGTPIASSVVTVTLGVPGETAKDGDQMLSASFCGIGCAQAWLTDAPAYLRERAAKLSNYGRLLAAFGAED